MRRSGTFLVAAALACTLAVPGLAQTSSISGLGNGVAVVFSPDFSDPGNRQFYESLGFLFFDSPDWAEVTATITTHNLISRDKVRIVVVESHGTNGNGLKLQASKEPDAPRSYISVGGLQERLEESGVDLVILTACNSGRLFRPSIYHELDPENGDPLFLPATLGIYGASDDFDSTRSTVRVFRREDSRLETLLHVSTSELEEPVRASVGLPSSSEFAISTILIQLLLDDPELELTDRGWVEEKSESDLPLDVSESLLTRFKTYLKDRIEPDLVVGTR